LSNPIEKISVIQIGSNDSDKSLWENYISQHKKTTIYHSTNWRNIFSEGFGYKSWYLLARRDLDHKIVGCLPLFRVPSLFSCRLVSIPFRDRGGLLWDSSEAFQALIFEAKQILQEEHASFLELKSLFTYPPEFIQKNGIFERIYWIHSAVNLKTHTNKEYWNIIGPKTRNMVRQAERSNCSFEDMTSIKDEVSLWYDLYLASQKSLGLPPLPLNFFSTLFDEKEKSAQIKLFLVRKGDAVISGMVLLLHKKTGIFAYGASLPWARAYRPNDFMILKAIEWLRDNGYEEFDMGSDSPQQNSLLWFKKKWLAIQKPIPMYYYGNYDHSLSDSMDPKYNLIRRGFQNLPVFVLRMIGGLTARYFG